MSVLQNIKVDTGPLGNYCPVHEQLVIMAVVMHFHFFHFGLFFCTQFSTFNSLRQLRHDAGGFSYKSMRTLRELFPLAISIVNKV